MPKEKVPNYVKWLTPIAVLLITISLLLLPYLSVFKSTFTNAQNTITFFENSSTFSYTSQIIKSEIQGRLPEKVQQNLIERSIINKLTDLIITPKLVQNIAEPVIKFQIKRLNSKQVLTLTNNNVEFNLQPYKENLSSYIASFKLGEGIETTLNNFVTSVPNSVTIVDGQKNPNSVLIKIVKLRQGYENILKAYTVAWVLIVFSALTLVGLFYKDLRKLFRMFAKIMIVSGISILALSYLAPALIANFVPTNITENSGSEINQLINSIVNQFFELSRSFVWWYLGLAVLFAIFAWYFKNFGVNFKPKEIQKYFQLKYHKLFKKKK